MAANAQLNIFNPHAGLAALSLLCFLSPAIADPQSPPVAPATATDQASAEQDSDYNESDFTRPERSATLRLEFRPSSTPTSTTERGNEILQYNSKLDLNAAWKLGMQLQVPFVEKSTVTFGQPGTESASGLGDALFQAALIRAMDERWAYGFGARLVAPPVSEALGTDRWQIMPAAGIRYSFLEAGPDTYFVPVVRYAIGFGGSSTARVIREPQIAPTLNIGLPDRWFFTLYPSNDIRINYGTPVSGQTGRLFLPFDAAIGKKFLNDLIVSLEGSVPIIKDYPVYDFKTELKVTWQF
ncbi:MAG: transporter [Methylovirgula sp.]